MRQTEDTAIVTRCVNYREHDRMLTLFSPTRGRLEVISRGCRRPKSPLLAASELFALGDFQLYEKAGRNTLVSAQLTETFYPLRTDFERLTCATYVLEICEAAVQPGQPARQLFMLLLHTLSRLAFSDQPWQPLAAGFLAHFSAIEGTLPDLTRCVRCGRPLPPQAPLVFSPAEGGLICPDCRRPADRGLLLMTPAERTWVLAALQRPASAWLETPEATAPLRLLRIYVEGQLERPLRSAGLLRDCPDRTDPDRTGQSGQ